MKCVELKEYLLPFLHNELSKEKVLSIGEHLKSCPSCRLIIEEERKFERFLKNTITIEEAPYPLAEKVISGIKRRRKLSLLVLRWIVPLAASLVFLWYFSFSGNIFDKVVLQHRQAVEKYQKGYSPAQGEVFKSFKDKGQIYGMVMDIKKKGADILEVKSLRLGIRKGLHIFYKKDKKFFSLFMCRGLPTKKKPYDEKIVLKGKTFYVFHKKGYNNIYFYDKKIFCLFITKTPYKEVIKFILDKNV